MSQILEFLSKFDNFYLNNAEQAYTTPTTLDPSDMVLYKVKSITFKQTGKSNAPRREALENVISALRIAGINFVYLVLGDSDGVHFYYGIVKDYASHRETAIDIDEIGDSILGPSLRGNFRGSEIALVDVAQKREILQQISSTKYCSMVEGVPGVLENEDEFQGVDRMANVMTTSEEFGFIIIASLLDDDGLQSTRQNIFEVYENLAATAKRSEQTSTAQSANTSTREADDKTNSKSTAQTQQAQTNKTDSESAQTSETKQIQEQDSKATSTANSTEKSEGERSRTSTSKSSNESSTKNTSKNNSTTTTSSKQGSKTESTSTSNTQNTSHTTSHNTSTETSTNKSSTNTSTIEHINKQAQDWLKYIDETLLPRLDYGSGKGMFISGMFCFANARTILTRLENTAISLFSGEKGNKVPLRSFLLEASAKDAIYNLQLPHLQGQKVDSTTSALLSQTPRCLGNLISSKELSLIAGLPKNDIIGLELKDEVEFGLNFEQFSNALELGSLVQSGDLTNKRVSLDKGALDKHIFITGVTGSGKTTTCQNILANSQLPFLVIEPAKTEYRILLDTYPDMLIFTLGKDTIAPFRLNPFEFFKHESITSRVDMIKASIEAAFDMEAAIPQIIESAIYECYKAKGWNIATNKNERHPDPFAPGVDSFPRLQDLFSQVEEVVKNQGFDERLKNDYIGSIKARLNGLMVGSKGFMLNTKRSVDFTKLLDKRVVFELEEIRNGGEKSLVMGFILTHLLEAIKANFMEQDKHELRHIVLVEEAHRLLSKYEPGDSQNKKQGVEVFTDMLAEIRKYGECLMIADQIPNKLTPEVLKNTNTKIVHRIFAADDKQAIANTMALEDEQKAFLSKLKAGRAIVFSGGFNKAIAVQIDQRFDTTQSIISDDAIRERILQFYASSEQAGVLVGSMSLSNPTPKDIELLLAFQKEALEKIALLREKNHNGKFDTSIQKLLEKYAALLSLEVLARIFMSECGIKSDRYEIAKEYIEKYINGSLYKDKDDVRRFKNNLFS